MSSIDVGAARSRLAARESFFGGPISTREQAKAPGWQAFIKQQPAEPAPGGGKAGKGGGGGSGARGGSKPGAPRQKQQAAVPQPNLEHERRQKIKQRRDFSGLDDDAAPAPPPPRVGGSGAARPQQTAAGPRQQHAQQQQQREQYRSISPSPGAANGGTQGRQKVTVKRAAGGGGGRMATAARGMAQEVTAAGKGRKQMASDALKQRVGEMVANHSGRSAGTAGGVGSPTFSGSGGTAGGAAAAARAAREAAGAKSVMTNKQYRTAAGMQTLQLVSRAPGQARGAAAGGAGGAGHAAMRAGAGTGSGGRPGMAPGSSPGSITKAPRPVTGAGAPRRLQQQHARAAGGGGGRGQPQVRGSFYGGQQPPAALEARMQYNKRRMSMDSGGDLDSFIASDDEGEGWESDAGGGEEDWRAALKEATGGYDPSKYRDIDKQGDRGMEAGYTQIQMEERRAARIARTEDEREAEAEALREAAKRERKRSRKTGVAAFVDDGSSD